MKKTKCKWAKYSDKTTSLKFPVFANYEIRVVSTNDVLAAIKKAKIDIPNLKPGDAFNIHVANKPLTWIFVPHNITLNHMVHEAYHAVIRMLEYFDVNTRDGEVVAYHLGYIVQEISDWRWSWK